jgi:hypothetical protein
MNKDEMESYSMTEHSSDNFEPAGPRGLEEPEPDPVEVEVNTFGEGWELAALTLDTARLRALGVPPGSSMVSIRVVDGVLLVKPIDDEGAN